jgi:hypothetical protein
MWRNSLGGSRDMYLVESADGVTFSRAEKLGAGTWPLNACPMDGGALAISQNRIVTAWRRERQIFLASRGEEEVSIGEGVDVAIAPAAAGVYAVWSSAGGIQAFSPALKPFLLAPKGSFPAIVALPGEQALVAWEDDGKIHLRHLQ